MTSPNRQRPEDFLLVDVLERELKALPRLPLPPDRPTGDDDNVFEYLFRKVPMLHRGAAADISGRKQRRDQNPSVVENAFRAEGIEGGGNIRAGANTSKPALFCPSCETLC